MTDDRDVEARLHEALSEGLAGHVDVVSLVDGARTGARRVRRRRRAAAGAALVVALAVPLGVGVWTWQQQGSGGLGVAASLPDTPSEPAPSLSLVPDPTESATPRVPPAPEVDPSTLDPDENAVDIPLDVLPTADDLPVPMVRLGAMAYRLSPVVMGQACNEGREGTEPIAGASDMWAEENSNRLDQLSVSTNVTAYSRGQGATAFTEARTDTGSCRWFDPGETTDYTSDGRQAFTRIVTEGGTQTSSLAVVEVGDLLVGVQVGGVGKVDIDEVAREVAATVAERLVEAQVPGSAG
jgi:hypothetical protein